MNLKFYLLSLLLLVKCHLFAQDTIRVRIVNPDTIAACNDNRFIATIAPQSDPFLLNLYSTIVPATASSGNCGLITKAQVLVDSVRRQSGGAIALSNVSLETDSGKWTGTIDSSLTDSIQVFYRIFIDCSTIPVNAANNLALGLLQSWLSPSGICILNGATPTADTLYPVRFPYLIRDSIPSFAIGYLDTMDLTYSYLNTGTSGGNLSFRFFPDTSLICRAIDTLGYFYKIGSTGAVTSFNIHQTIPFHLNRYDTLFIIERIKADTCIPSVCSSAASLSWSCNAPVIIAPDVCSSCQIINTPINAINTANQLRIIRREPQTAYSANFDTSCINDPAAGRLWKYAITVQGAGKLDSLVFNFTNSDPLGLNQLSLISIGEIGINTICDNCTIDFIDTLQNPNALCQNLVNDPLGRMTIYLRNFGENDTLEFNFKTYRCVENNPDLFNTEKRFNHWRFENTYGKTICGQRINLPLPVDSEYFAVNNITNHIGASLDLQLNFSPLVTDLTANPNIPWGDSAALVIRHNGYLGFGNDPINHQLFGCYMDDGNSCIKRGWLRIDLDTKPGLAPAYIKPDTLAFFSYLDNFSRLNKITPVYYSFSDTSSACTDRITSFYFSMSDTNLVHALNDGKFQFMLKSCCGGQTGGTPYVLRYYFLLSPATNCTNINFPTTGHLLAPTYSNGDSTWLPLSTAEDVIVVHCPGCITPGMVVSKYSIKRISFGLQDSNDDGLADSIPAIIQENSQWYEDRASDIGYYNVSLGDQVQDRLTAYFSAGDSAAGGYTYHYQMTQRNSLLKHLQLSRKMPYSDQNGMNLRVDSITVYFDLPDTSLQPCLDCSAFGMDSTKFVTQRKLIIKDTLLVHYLSRPVLDYYLINLTNYYDSGRQGNVFHPYATVYVNTAKDTAGYFENQRIRIQTNYSVCGNINTTALNITPGIDDVRYESEIKNAVWLSGKLQSANALSSTGMQQPQNNTALESAGWTFNPIDTNRQQVNQNFADSFLFYCEDYGGKIYFISQDVFNASRLSSTGYDCKKTLELSTLSRMAGGVFDPYPYEYKPGLLHPLTYTFNLPANHYISSIIAFNRLNQNGVIYLSDTILLNPTDSLGPLQISDSIFPVLPCLYDSSNRSGPFFYFGDLITNRVMQLTLTPFNCQDNTVAISGDSTTLITTGVPFQTCHTYSPCARFYSDTLPHLYKDTITIEPQLQYQYPTIIQAGTTQICFPISISNYASGSSNYAPNIFIYPPANTAYLQNWTVYLNGDTLLPNQGLFEIDTLLPAGSSLNLELCARLIDCLQQPDTIMPIIGWNCNGYPDSLPPCFNDTLTFIVIPDSAVVEALRPAAREILRYSLCEPFTIKKCFQSIDNGELTPLYIQLSDSLPELYTLLLQANRDTTGDSLLVTLPPVPGTSYQFVITDSVMSSIGDDDGVLTRNECFCVTITYNSGCDTLISGLPDIEFTGINYCGDTIRKKAVTGIDLLWDSTSACHDCFELSKHILEDTVMVGDTITYLITICGNNDTSQFVFPIDSLPQNFVVTQPLMTSSVAIPKDSCITLTLKGYFTAIAQCPVPTNRAFILYAEYDSLNHPTTQSDTLMAEVCTDVLPACISDSTIYLANNSSASNLGTQLDYFEYYIKDTFIIDQNITFNHCRLIMAAGSSIEVIGNAVINLYYSEVVGCDSMWQGFQIIQQGEVFLEDSSLIKDAHIAIQTGNKGTVKIINSALLNNHIGIEVPSLYPDLFAGILYLHGAHLGMNAPFKPDYLHQPAHGARPYAGIVLNDAVVQLGGDHLYKNSFFHMNNGIRAFRSSIKVKNCRFDQIKADPFYFNSSNENGSAICVTGEDEILQVVPASLYMTPNPDGSSNVTNSTCGVFTSLAATEVYGCAFDTVDTGVDIRHLGIGIYAYLNQNTIRAYGYGIRMLENDGADLIFAEGNQITLFNRDKWATGIDAGESNPQHTVRHHLSNNIVRLYNASAGIRLQGIQNALINFNQIELAVPSSGYSPSYSTTGIDIGGGGFNTITCNYSYGHQVTDTLRYAYRVVQSNDNFIDCNTADSTGYSFRFEGVACTKTKLRGNYMGNAYCGLFLNTEAIIGQQPVMASINTPYHANVWLDSARYTSGYGAVNLNTDTITNLSLSLFTTNVSVINHNPKIPDITSPPPFYVNNNGWFDKLPGGSSFDCNRSNICISALQDTGDGYDEQLRFRVINDSSVSSVFIPESKQIAAQLIYAELKADTLAWTNTIYSDFITFKEYQSEGILYKTDSVLAAINSLRKDFNNEAAVLIEPIRMLSDSLASIDSIISILNDTVLVNAKEHLLSLVAALNLELNDLNIDYTSVVGPRLIAKQLLNHQLSPMQLPDANQKEVERVSSLCKQIGVQAILDNYQQIAQIAFQCPSAGGPAVFHARSLIQLVNDTITYDDLSTCTQLGILRMAHQQSPLPLKQSFIISPNPAGTEVRLYLDRKLQENYKLNIINSIGEVIHQNYYNHIINSISLSVSNYPSGVYTIQLLNDAGDCMNEKLVIIR